MNSETEEETRLSDELQHLVARPPFQLNQADIERRAHRSRQRQILTRGLAGVAALGVLAAGGVAVSAQPWSSGSPAGSSAAGPAKAVTLADVEKGVLNSLANLNDYVVEGYSPASKTGGEANTIWVDARTGDVMQMSNGLHDWIYNSDSSSHVMQLNSVAVYPPSHSYYSTTTKAAKPLSDYGDGSGFSLTPGPQQLKQQISAGTLKILGYAEVDGHHTVELAGTSPGPSSKFWADTSTYQVVRASLVLKAGGHTLPAQVADYTWLPRSASLLKQMTTPVIPAGYKQLPHLP